MQRRIKHRLQSMIAVLFLMIVVSCKNNKDRGGTYVSPSIDKNGKLRKGHVRMPVSADKNANANRARSRYYYKTRGRYRKRGK